MAMSTSAARVSRRVVVVDENDQCRSRSMTYTSLVKRLRMRPDGEKGRSDCVSSTCKQHP